LGVTYKTAWRMFTLIRSRLDDESDPFGGESTDVEIDETYVGGKRKGKRGRGAEGKTPVLGMVQRKGELKAIAVPDTKRKTVMPIIEGTVKEGTTVHTDEYSVYDILESKGYVHKRVMHSQKIYVVGNVHTQTIDGFWALVKNGITGVYHHVSPEYLQRYLNEYGFRYNHRNDVTPMFRTFLFRVGVTL
jgi:transposase-like protein